MYQMENLYSLCFELKRLTGAGKRASLGEINPPLDSFEDAATKIIEASSPEALDGLCILSKETASLRRKGFQEGLKPEQVLPGLALLIRQVILLRGTDLSQPETLIRESPVFGSEIPWWMFDDEGKFTTHFWLLTKATCEAFRLRTGGEALERRDWPKFFRTHAGICEHDLKGTISEWRATKKRPAELTDLLTSTGKSGSFHVLWLAIVGKMTRERVIEQINGNPWLRPDWRPRLQELLIPAHQGDGELWDGPLIETLADPAELPIGATKPPKSFELKWKTCISPHDRSAFFGVAASDKWKANEVRVRVPAGKPSEMRRWQNPADFIEIPVTLEAMVDGISVGAKLSKKGRNVWRESLLEPVAWLGCIFKEWSPAGNSKYEGPDSKSPCRSRRLENAEITISVEAPNDWEPSAKGVLSERNRMIAETKPIKQRNKDRLAFNFPRPRSFAGLGGRVSLKHGDRELLAVTDECTDQGIIEAVGPISGGCLIALAGPYEFDEGHQLWAWSRGSLPKVVAISLKDQSCDQQSFIIPNLNWNEFLGLAISYRGHRVGSWLRPVEWTSVMDCHDQAASPNKLAAWLQWWRAPILSKAAQGPFSTFFRQHLADALPVWLDSSVAVCGESWLPVSHLKDDSYWLEAVRECHLDSPRILTSEQVVELAKACRCESAASLTHQLLTICPILGLGAAVQASEADAQITQDSGKAEQLAKRFKVDTNRVLKSIPSLNLSGNMVTTAFSAEFRRFCHEPHFRQLALHEWLADRQGRARITV